MSFQGSSNRLAVTLRHVRQVTPCSVPPPEWARTRSIWLSRRRPSQGNHPTSPLRRRHQCRWPPKLRGRESSPTVTWKKDKRSSGNLPGVHGMSPSGPGAARRRSHGKIVLRVASREDKIRDRAYELYLARGAQPGREL